MLTAFEVIVAMAGGAPPLIVETGSLRRLASDVRGRPVDENEAPLPPKTKLLRRSAERGSLAVSSPSVHVTER